MPDSGLPTRALSAREAEVVGLVVAGKSNRAIAETLTLSERTVEHHVTGIFNKLNVRSRIELVAVMLSGPSAAANRASRLREQNLPLQLTSFVGRATEVAEVAQLVGTHRMVTLTGSGGVGKTRLSLKVGAGLSERFDDGVWFVEFAPLTSGDYLITTIAQAIGLTLGSGDASEKLVRVLKPKCALLIFDNCEHLLEPIAHVAGTILRNCPNISLLASSRQRLGIAGERAYRLASLPTPVFSDLQQFRALDAMQTSAIELFVDRASMLHKTFELTDENAASVAEICRRLDGIPLAIELAASRVDMLSPRQLQERLDERFRVLVGGNRDALPRQRTLLATIDWSHDLIDARERTLFRRLGIFANGFSLEAAIAVGHGPELEFVEVFDVLSSLVDNSLVFGELDGDRQRYRFLESTRAYASSKLQSAGEYEAVAERHLRYFHDYFASLRAESERSFRSVDKRRALTTELEDVRAALSGAIARSDIVLGAELLVSIGITWTLIGREIEARSWQERFLEVLPHDRSMLRSRISTILSECHFDMGEKQRAFEIAQSAVELARASGDAETLGWALKAYIYAAIDIGQLWEAEIAIGEAETLSTISPLLATRFRRTRAYLSQAGGDYATAAVLYEQVTNDYRAHEDDVGVQTALLNLAVNEHMRGRTDRAVAIVEEMLPAARASADTFQLALCLRDYAGFLAVTGELERAAAAACEATELFVASQPESSNVATSVETLALVRALQGDVVGAGVLAGYVEAAFRREPFTREPTGAKAHDRLAELLRTRLGPEEVERLGTQGAALSAETAVAHALGPG